MYHANYIYSQLTGLAECLPVRCMYHANYIYSQSFRRTKSVLHAVCTMQIIYIHNITCITPIQPIAVCTMQIIYIHNRYSISCLCTYDKALQQARNIILCYHNLKKSIRLHAPQTTLSTGISFSTVNFFISFSTYIESALYNEVWRHA